jgi:hypothetical protein
MEASLTAGWGDFYVAIGGAGAALAGLVMVGISVSLTEILADHSLPARAAAAIGSLILVVVVAGVGLIPGEPAPTLGIEILVGTLLATVQHVTAIMRMTSESKRPVATLVARSAVAAVQLVPLAVGSILLIASNASGLYWIAGRNDPDHHRLRALRLGAVDRDPALKDRLFFSDPHPALVPQHLTPHGQANKVPSSCSSSWW